VATLVALGVASGRLIAQGAPPQASDLLIDALCAAAAAFVVGSLVCFVAPRRGAAPAPGDFDPFSARSG
jgi:hypothetical protein